LNEGSEIVEHAPKKLRNVAGHISGDGYEAAKLVVLGWDTYYLRFHCPLPKAKSSLQT
jgi:hypothetical protein